MSSDSPPNSRRTFLKSGLLAISTVALPAGAATAEAAENTQTPQHFLTATERQFLLAAVDRLIPADEHWTGAAGAGVVNYIDLQMAGAWGKGDLINRSGPFRSGSWTQGYQLEYTPAELFRRSIHAINTTLSAQGTPFSSLSPADKDAYLTRLEKGEFDLDGVPSNIFFDFLWKHTQEGFFSDPIYGGNKNKVGWKMLGFPGAYDDYFELIEKHGMKLDREPIGMGDGMHMHSAGAKGKV